MYTKEVFPITEQPTVSRMHVGHTATVLRRSAEERIQAILAITMTTCLGRRVLSTSDAMRESNEAGNMYFLEEETPM